MTVKIVLEDEFTAKLDKLGASAGKILDNILRVTGAKYRDSIRRRYLSGQMLRKRSGELVRSVKAQKLRRAKHTVLISGSPKLANIYEHVGGVTITPRHGGALRFEQDGKTIFTRKPIHLAQRPFMTASAKVFPFGSTFEEVAERTFAREFEKRGIS